MSSTVITGDHVSVAPLSRLGSNRAPRRVRLALAAVLFAGCACLLWASSALAVSTLSPAAVVHYEQSNSRLLYAGSWTTASNTSASGKSFALANSSGASVTIRFIGTHLSWIAKKGPLYGEAKVTMDGKSLGLIDLYSASTEWQQKVWGTGTLAFGPHTVTIAWTGTKNSDATDTNIGVDAFDVVGSLTQVP